MKKLLLLPLLITLSTTILAKTPESLFGVYINDNVLDYVTQKELKSKSRDRVRGFYGLELKNPPISNKDFSDKLYVRFDKNNKIAQIKSEKHLQNFETCKRVGVDVRKALETKYDIKLKRISIPRDSFMGVFGVSGIVSECTVSGDKTVLLISLMTSEYIFKLNESLYSKI